MNVGDFVRDDQSTLWMVIEKSAPEFRPEMAFSPCVKVVRAGGDLNWNTKHWRHEDAFTVVSECQENVKTDSDTLRPASQRVTL